CRGPAETSCIGSGCEARTAVVSLSGGGASHCALSLTLLRLPPTSSQPYGSSWLRQRPVPNPFAPNSPPFRGRDGGRSAGERLPTGVTLGHTRDAGGCRATKFRWYHAGHPDQ